MQFSEKAHEKKVLRTKSISSCVMNMAEARREIAHALYLHRASSSSFSPSPSSSSSSSQPAIGGESTVIGNSFDYSNPISGVSQYCYSLIESMPLPEPIWSTTAPSILAAPPPPGAMESPEFEWGENQASYTWWLGFLQTLDGKHSEEPNLPFGNSGPLFSQCEEPTFLDSSGQSSSPDEWLMFPTTEDQGNINVIPQERTFKNPSSG
ncbi:hypothetical protein CJ030_MR2G016408 [Morella rubra]|uniref:Uncharacterized protein n=1 Tax=Morella rubra TaxID=262757 RepID=A0A6A1WGR8_9ROSI|nr:hypothetical protein CJ030_MR2G016408 [Morella rubra]